MRPCFRHGCGTRDLQSDTAEGGLQAGAWGLLRLVGEPDAGVRPKPQVVELRGHRLRGRDFVRLQKPVRRDGA